MSVRPRLPRLRRIHTARPSGVDLPALNAMRTAEWVFTRTQTRADDLLAVAAHALAAQPGSMCLVSLLDGEVLRPATVAHAKPANAAALRQVLERTIDRHADAFSRAAQQSCSALRMQIGSHSLLKLWLPEPYLEYAEQRHINAVLAAPLVVRGSVLGTFLLWREGEHATAYTEADQAYVAGLASRLALGLRSLSH